jgi:hypothetical protein
MARQRLYDYVFTPGTAGLGTIKVPGRWELSDFLAIYDTTQNVNIYNFGDPALGGTVTYTASNTSDFPTSYDGVTTLALDLNTSSLSSSDAIAVYVESPNLEVKMWPFGEDAIGRQRVANPTALIDADFEYGLQNTKWQNFSVCNNIPGFYDDTGADLTISTNGYASFIAGDDTITSNVDTAVRLSNSGGSAPWIQNDFALLISQTTGNTATYTSTYLTANVLSPQEREFTVASSTGFAAGDRVVIIPRPTSGGTTVATTITSTATTTVVVTNAATANIVDGTYVIVETDTAGVYETMAVTNVSTNTLTVIRQTNNTNAGGSNITSGRAIYVVPRIEVASVIEVPDSTTIDLSRGWYNIPSVSSAATGTIIQKLSNQVELVQHTGISTAVNGAQTIARGAYNNTPLTAAGVGSLFVRMTGVYNTSTDTEVQIVGVNAPDHGIPEFGYVNAINLEQSQAEGVSIVTDEEYNTNNFAFIPCVPAALPVIGFPLNRTDTILRQAFPFTGANLDILSITGNGGNPATITVTTRYAHGLVPGTIILANLTSGTNYEYATRGSFVVSVPTTNSFTYPAKAGAAVSGSLTGNVFVRSSAVFLPRPFDGGVIMTSGAPTRGASAIRQTKKYFRYQSGKGLLFTSGTMLKPTFDITRLTASGTAIGSEIYVETDIEHGLNPGAVVELSGINAGGYNFSGYVVTEITSDESFVVQAQYELATASPELAPQPRVNVESWHGAAVRAGIFDDQNGLFWECDGQSVNVVQRSSTFQVAGLVSVGTGSNLVVGDDVSRFQEQLNNGDQVVIRGMTHTVTGILNEKRMTVVPTYRGLTNENRVKMCLRQEIRVRQPDFNIDTLDGTGPSGYVLDSGRMQMLGIEYSWYGAGYVQWMIRGQRGEMVPVHRRPNNNINYEAYMRSGNLPARYEAINETPVQGLAEAIDSSQTSIELTDATDYPAASVPYPVYVMIDSEIIKYSGKTGNTLTGCTRGATFQQWIQGQNRSFTSSAATSHDATTGVILISNTCTPVVNHWGSSVIMDGGFDADAAFQYTYNRTNFGLPATVGEKSLVFAMRLAPSVSNGIIGDLGERDLINRSQLSLVSLNVQGTAGRYLVEGILNPNNINAANTSWQGLNNAGGGFQPSFSQFTVAPTYEASTTGGVTGAPLNTAGGFARSGTKVSRSSSRTFANLTPAVVSSATGANAVVTVSLTGPGTTYSPTTTAITVQNPGTGYAVGDTLKILGNALGSSTPANDLNLTVLAVTTEIEGGERLFAIPVNAATGGTLDLSLVKQIGTSAIPGTGTYPNGPEVLAVQITALTAQTAPTGDVQLSFKESQA